MKRDYLLILLVTAGLAGVTLISRAMDAQRPEMKDQFAEEPLYLNPGAMKRLTLAFNGIAADWYWMRSLQYVGRKVIAYQDANEGRLDFKGLSELNLGLLPSLLKMSATLDPQFMPPYYYGAVLLPEIDGDQAIALLNQGIAANPQTWRLYQHLGYIYWQRHDYEHASAVYTTGSKLAGAPAWMTVMGGRMKAEGGSYEAAREMYQHLYDASNDDAVKTMVAAQIMRLDSLAQQIVIRRALLAWVTRSGRCVSSWSDVAVPLRSAGLTLDPSTQAPIDPSGVPYRLTKGGCEVDLDEHSQVPRG